VAAIPETPSAARPASAGLDNILADAQARTMRTINWTLIFVGPILSVLSLLVVFSRRDVSWATVLSLVILMTGPVVQFLLRNRWPVRRTSILFMGWLTALLVTACLHNGPFIGLGIAWAVVMLVAIFFVGRRAGLVVLVAFGLLLTVQIVLIRAGVIPMPQDIAIRDDYAGGLGVLIRISFGGLAGLVLCFAAFSMMHEALKQALHRMAEEKSLRDTAEAAQQRAEEIMKANQHYEALGKLVSGVAHDVNNALTSVLGHAELLRYSLPAGEEQTYAEDIISAARSAAHTTRQLLSLNRRALCQPISVDPLQMVETVTRLVQRLLPESITVKLEGRSGRLILVDPADLQQALLNLVLNARDAMPTGGTLTLRVADESTAGPAAASAIRLEVTDTGSGIPPEIVPRIFEPFFTTKPVGHGTGLGLAMVRLFVDEAGGQIKVNSVVGAGTTIALIFPESPLSAPDPSRPGEEPGHAAAGEHILVVEDQPELAALMERVLARGGYQVRLVRSAAAALECLAEGGKFEMLCADGVMGPTPVHRVIERYRAINPLGTVLVCSGHLDDELVRHGVAARDIDLLRKPFTGTELLARVRQVLRPRR